MIYSSETGFHKNKNLIQQHFSHFYEKGYIKHINYYIKLK